MDRRVIQMNKWIIGIGVVALIAVLAFTNGFGLFGKAGSGVTGSAVATSGVNIPLSEITQQAKWYEYDSNGVKIRFFAVKADDDSIKTGFDACDICWNSRKGYRQEGTYMICNNCGNRYPISGLGTENKRPGGCWPGYLPSSIRGDNLVITKSNLEKGRRMFI
jgi:uncharacterized membrane protein